MKASHKVTVIIIAAAAILATASVLAVAAAGGGFGRTARSPLQSSPCSVPALSGTVIDATLINMGGPMMGGPGNSVIGGMMRLTLDHNTVPHGQVSFLAINGGNITHELIVLPLPTNQIVGTRPIGPDAKIDETGTLGEASNTCAQDSGNGIAPGASSWATVTLAPGQYEIVCNLAGHYAAGMYAQLTVT